MRESITKTKLTFTFLISYRIYTRIYTHNYMFDMFGFLFECIVKQKLISSRKGIKNFMEKKNLDFTVNISKQD